MDVGNRWIGGAITVRISALLATRGGNMEETQSAEKNEILGFLTKSAEEMAEIGNE